MYSIFKSSYLQANSRLTWRDMQHIVIQTANSEPLLHEDGWAFNGIGRKFSHKVSVFLEDLFFKYQNPAKNMFSDPIACRKVASVVVP